jgi:hypothetical protein
MTNQLTSLQELLEFQLLQALFRRRACRFGVGMENPSGPLAFRSNRDAMPLTELEQMSRGSGDWHIGMDVRGPFRTSHYGVSR